LQEGESQVGSVAALDGNADASQAPVIRPLDISELATLRTHLLACPQDKFTDRNSAIKEVVDKIITNRRQTKQDIEQGKRDVALLRNLLSGNIQSLDEQKDLLDRTKTVYLQASPSFPTEREGYSRRDFAEMAQSSQFLASRSSQKSPELLDPAALAQKMGRAVPRGACHFMQGLRETQEAAAPETSSLMSIATDRTNPGLLKQEILAALPLQNFSGKDETEYGLEVDLRQNPPADVVWDRPPARAPAPLGLSAEGREPSRSRRKTEEETKLQSVSKTKQPSAKYQCRT
jgi:hypothetical protein